MANLRYRMRGKVTWQSISDPAIFYVERTSPLDTTHEVDYWLCTQNKFLWDSECKLRRQGVEYRIFRLELEMLDWMEGGLDNPLGLSLV